jgi:DNA mismatch repair protein MutL
MGKIHVLPEHVANKIAAGEVVERPASVVKELLENSLDAGARRIRINVEAGGKRLIHIVDDGCGMVRDDALLAFERHATSKLKNADDLLAIATLGFRGEALPSIGAVSRLRLETRAPEETSGTIVEVAGGRILRVDEAGLPAGTAITVRDLFFNIPARRKFLRAEATELSHIASLITHYALAHPDKHFELHSATNAILIAAPVESRADRIYQIFGKETLNDLLPVAAALPLQHSGLPHRASPDPDVDQDAIAGETPGEIRLHGFVSRPEVQKLNRNSIFIFVNGRLIRDRLVLHAFSEAYRNLMPPTVFPVVLLFLELPFAEVDVNVHPSKTEVRFRQHGFIHDFVRDSVRAALLKARPVPQFRREIAARPTASQALTPGADPELGVTAEDAEFALHPPPLPPRNERLTFGEDSISIGGNAAIPVARFPRQTFGGPAPDAATHGEQPHDAPAPVEEGTDTPAQVELAGLRPLGQIENSFIVAAGEESLWIIDQHVAHERVLFEKVLRQQAANQVESQRLLMPLIVELTPAQQAVFADISEELARNGFEVEPFGSRTIAVKTAPAGLEAASLEQMLHELLNQLEREQQATNLESLRREIAASIACHAAIKINTPLEIHKMEWLLRALAQTECPISCPHGRPIVLRYSIKEIQRAFKRI